MTGEHLKTGMHNAYKNAKKSVTFQSLLTIIISCGVIAGGIYEFGVAWSDERYVLKTEMQLAQSALAAEIVNTVACAQFEDLAAQIEHLQILADDRPLTGDELSQMKVLIRRQGRVDCTE